METSADPEADLVLAAQGDPGRFSELYRRHVHLVHSVAYARLGDRAVAEDITAETFRRALRALPRYEPRGIPFRAWLMRICTNLVKDERERRVRAARYAVTAADPPVSADVSAEIDARATLQALVEQLAPDRRAVLELRFAEDLPVAEVARRLARTPGAVKQLQRRALDDLRGLLAERDGGRCVG